jgi:hypothetical protein
LRSRRIVSLDADGFTAGDDISVNQPGATYYWTTRGDPVRTLLDRMPMPSGLNQATAWDGRNGRGNVVTNGAYIAGLEVVYDDGGRDRLRRKIAVVR